MTRLTNFGRFLWDFVVGDDWRIAVAVVIAMGVTAIASGGLAAWWILPLFVAVILTVSVFSVARKR